jgi:hypothetical protein
MRYGDWHDFGGQLPGLAGRLRIESCTGMFGNETNTTILLRTVNELLRET